MKFSAFWQKQQASSLTSFRRSLHCCLIWLTGTHSSLIVFPACTDWSLRPVCALLTRNWSHIATHLVFLVVSVALLLLDLVGASSSKIKTPIGSVISNRIGVTSGMIVLQVDTHRLMEADFWYKVVISRRRPWHHFTRKSAAAVTQHLLGPCVAVSVRSWSIVGTFVLVYTVTLWQFIIPIASL